MKPPKKKIDLVLVITTGFFFFLSQKYLLKINCRHICGCLVEDGHCIKIKHWDIGSK